MAVGPCDKPVECYTHLMTAVEGLSVHSGCSTSGKGESKVGKRSTWQSQFDSRQTRGHQAVETLIVRMSGESRSGRPSIDLRTDA